MPVDSPGFKSCQSGHIADSPYAESTFRHSETGQDLLHWQKGPAGPAGGCIPRSNITYAASIRHIWVERIWENRIGLQIC
jgi:hypothetical protein